MKLLRKVGSTSEIWQIFIRDSSSTTGAGLTGLTNASSSLTAYYHRDTDTTATVINLVSMTVGTFTSSGFKEIDSANMPGWYQFCPPNNALASGAKSCAFHLKGVTNMAPLPIEVDLDGQVDVTFWNGTVVASPATAGIPDVNVKNVNNVSTSTVTTINANQGTTQPINFTGTGASALAKSDMVDIAGSAVSTSTAQIGVNVVNFGGSAGTFAAGRPEVNTTHFAGTISAGAAGYVGLDWGHVTAQSTTVNLTGTTVGTITTYTGNTVQTGDSFARIGATGSGLTSLAPSATALSTVIWTAPPTGFLAATFPSGTIANTTNITAGNITTTTNLTNAPTSGDFTVTMKGTLAALMDYLLERDMSNVESAAAVHSLCTAILKLTSAFDVNASSTTAVTYKTDGVTPMMTQVKTVNSSLVPVQKLGVGS